MAYIAKRRLKIEGGKYAEIGDVVPGAAQWRNLNTYLRLEWIKEVPDGDVPEPVAETEQEGGPGDLSTLSVSELKARAREAGLTGYSSMRKAELVDALSG